MKRLVSGWQRSKNEASCCRNLNKSKPSNVRARQVAKKSRAEIPQDDRLKSEIRSTGLDKLDNILEGGYPESAAILVAGPTGSGKDRSATPSSLEVYRKETSAFMYRGCLFKMS